MQDPDLAANKAKDIMPSESQASFNEKPENSFGDKPHYPS